MPDAFDLQTDSMPTAVERGQTDAAVQNLSHEETLAGG
jgi:hypothetical protein